MELFSFRGKEIKGTHSRKETKQNLLVLSFVACFSFLYIQVCFVIPIDQRNVPSKAVAKGEVRL
jgi:hypothetical protein